MHEPGQLVDGLAHAGDPRGQGGARVGEHGGTGVGEAHGLARPVEERLAELLFQRADLALTPDWLMWTRSAARVKFAVSATADEVLELTDLHNHRF